MKKTLKKLTAFLTSVLMCGVSLLDFPAGSFNISLPSWAADEGGGIYVCNHAYINGFCISCEAYQPAVQVSDKYDLDGDGATESVYEIGNAGQLYWFAKFVNQGNGNEESEAVLTDDISVNANVINENGELNSGSFRNWTPIGNEPACSFNGFFDGQNHEISGLHCVDLNDVPVGLFGITVGYGRSISNVKIVDSYFFGTGYSGGICGLSNHDIKNCYNEGTVVSQGNAGGICGSAQASNIENCGNSGRIVCKENAGGIYGYGDLNYSITNCFNNGIISGESQAGEIGGITSSGSLKNCCYNSEINGLEVIGSGAEAATMDNVVGKTTAEIESGEAAYFLGDAWGQNLDNGETKQDLPVLGGAKVYQIEKYSKCDKSDTPVTAYSNTDKTQVAEHIIENGFCVNCDYLQPAVNIDGRTYGIGNAGQLYWFANLTNENRFGNYLDAILTSDIVVNENVLNDDMELNEGTYRQWTPIGKEYDYKGAFDGNNHTISGLYYNDSSYCKALGLIGTAADSSEIRNLGIVDSYFRGNASAEHSGGICGDSAGKIINCFSICKIEGKVNVGGICGFFSGNYLINCYSLSSLVEGSGESGKICGKERGLVDNCYYDSETINTRGGRTIEEFENGTVAYLLAKGSDWYSVENSWGQNLDNDEPKQKYPTLNGAKVYEVKKYSKCDKSDTPVTVYSNTDKEQVPAHVIENGFCKNCDYLQPAVLNSENQYEIGNAGQLYWFAKFTNESESNSNANAILTSDIVVNENVLNDELELNKGDYRKWTPISSSDESNYREFQGTFDGKNHTISGLYFNDTRYMGAGLIGMAAESSKIMNLGIVDSYFKAEVAPGAICGDSVGSIINCFSICRVEGEMAGGICGTYSNENNSGGNYFINCYSLSKVSGSQSGTICGQLLGAIIDNCYFNEEPACGMNNGSDWTDIKTIEEFENGTVAYYLAKGSSWHPVATPWGQNLDNDEPKQKYPSLGGAKVYQVKKYSKCDKSDTPVTVYSNTDKEQVPAHVIENGFCKNCDYLQPAVMNSNYQYEIGNAGQLYWLADKVNNGETSLNAILTADISVNEGDVSGCDGNKAEGWRDWTPIGSVSNIYSGTFDGQNHTVSGLYFNDNWANYVGLFGWSNGTIQNIGIICSYFYGYECVGGVCGITESTIRNCYNTGTVFGSSKTGGMCGYNNYGTIENCYNIGTVFGTGSKVGGVCGYNNNDTVTNCYYLDTCAAEGTTFDNTDGTSKTAEQFASGEVTYLLNGSKSEGDTVHFYQNLSGENADALPVLDKSHGVVYFYTDCTDKTCYANSETASGEHDFDENGFCTKDSTHYQPATLNETTENYEISNAGQLYWFAKLVNGTLDGVEQNASANAILTSDIIVNENVLNENGELNGGTFRNWTPIGSSDYSGTFDGNNHTISGLYFNDRTIDSVGLFRRSSETAKITNVGIVDSYLNAGSTVGAMCGLNYGIIENCYNTGSVNGITKIGGICGSNGKNANIINCYNRGTVTSDSDASGICGSNGPSFSGNSSKIKNCYNTGSIEGKSVDGICYANMLKDSIIENCYYNNEILISKGTPINTGTTTNVLGKTTAEFESGEVAYLLGEAWGQNIDNGETKQSLPEFSDARVYQNRVYSKCDKSDTPVVSYSNTQVEDVVPAHSFVNGRCSECGLFENKIGERLEGYSVDLDGSIGVSFYMLLDPRVAADEKSYMQFTLPNGDTKKVYSNMTLTAEVDGETYNIFTCNIAAKEMTSEIKAQMFSSDAEGQIYSFTVADYANYIIKNSSKYSSETVALVKAMMNYGKYAKAYFDGEVLEATAEMNNVTADTLAEYKMSESGELPEGVTYYGSSLLLESKTVVRHYFKVEEGVDAESYGFSEHKGMYYYDDCELFADNLVDLSWNFRFSDYTLTYGPMSYSYAVLTNHSDDKALVNLVKSLYLYGKAASDYSNADIPVYLRPNSEWLEGNARFAVYAWNDAGYKWFDCADAGDGIHFVVKDFDDSYKNVIFCRMNPDTTVNNWDNRLNATVDTVVPTNKNRCYRLDEGTLNNVGGSWGSSSFLL